MKRLGFPTAVLLGAASCAQSPPSGQVVARVNGVEITRRDVLIELIASNAPIDLDAGAAQPALLERIITRKLLAEEAMRQSVDRSPEFLGQERRSRELILGEQLARRVIGRLPPPSPAAVAAFVTGNQTRFDRRQILHVDRITLATPPDATLLRLPSNDLIAKRLRRQGVDFGRVLVDIDTLTLSAARQASLAASDGRPFGSETRDGVVIDQQLSAVQRPTTAAQRVELAASILRDQRAQQAVTAMSARLKAAAQIEYAAGQAVRP